MSEPVRRALPPSVFARLGEAARYVITGVSPDTWFGPLQPLAPMAPPEVKGRQWDYPFGANLNYVPRSDDGVSFAELRALADALPLLRAVIEARKDQIAAQNPFLGESSEGVGRRAGAIIVEGGRVAPERNIDGERDLLDRAHAIEPVGARVARQIKQLLGREIGGRNPFEDLLIGGIGRLGEAPVLTDERLDRRPVDHVERIKRT